MHELALALCAATTFALSGPEDSPSELKLLDHAGLTAAIAQIGTAHPGVATVLPIGTSREGRSIEAVELSGAEAPGKPAILIVANLDGPDVFDSAVALEHATQLAEGYGSDDAITALLDTTTLLIIPRANPDAAEARFVSPRWERNVGGRGVDNDRDGRTGEDPPSDVDGDGAITQIRVLDPEGTWIVDPTDERVLVEADPKQGERGKYRVWTEGRDLDGDEQIAEDPVLDTRLNRNFPSGWEEHADDAGLFPSDEPEVRALMEFVMLRDDLALVLCYGAPENLVEKPSSVKDDAKNVMRIPPAGILQSDADMLAVLAKHYKETTENESKRAASDEGSFQRWAYDHRGLMTLSAVLWQMPEEWTEPEPDEEPAEEVSDEEAEEEEEMPDEGAEKPKKEKPPEPSPGAKRMKWVDGSEESWRFVPWKSFEHPELGAVEIGGFSPFALTEPPKSEWNAIAEREFEFVKELGSYLARVELAECVAIDLGGGLWRVEATVENPSLLPLQSRSARRTRTIRPAMLSIELPEGAKLLGGQVQKQISDLAGSGEREETVWLVSIETPDLITVSLETVNAGGATMRPEVN